MRLELFNKQATDGKLYRAVRNRLVSGRNGVTLTHSPFRRTVRIRWSVSGFTSEIGDRFDCA